jgi:hypothetical protein
MTKARDLANFATQADEELTDEKEVINTNFLLMGA